MILLVIMLAFRMVRRRRGELDIFADVLGAALKDVKFTHLMYRVNLSYSTIRKYLFAALDKGLICRVNNGDGSVVYCTTESGRLLLEKLEDVKIILHG
jgi:predicted transcriptional regulator